MKIRTTYWLSMAALLLTAGCETPPTDRLAENIAPFVDRDVHLIIKNRNTKELALLVKPETLPESRAPGMTTHRLDLVAFTVPAAPNNKSSTDVVLNVPAHKLGKFDYYSIYGETNPLTHIGTCNRLEPGKWYQVEFTNNRFGTDCIAIRIAQPPASALRNLQPISTRNTLTHSEISSYSKHPASVVISTE
ncbi:hypothetical protein [Candidatus Odyssella thessalonicensis]|uniref:hypothetical protein n=1 Tax=Candidatus Odyssella thessalonicensis TaxID=84647 RepID=UPI000225B4AF|nr:hypothetical protein [Candidatus Odyssella thessalonicensis]